MRHGVKSDRQRALFVALVALTAALLVGDPAGGTATTTIRIGSAEGAPGDQVTVRLEALGVPDPGLGAFTIDITYDPDVASAVGCEEDPDRILDTVFCNMSFKNNTVRVGGFRTAVDAIGGVLLADITFQFVGETSACGSLTPTAGEFVNTQGQPIMPLDFVAGSLCVGGSSSIATAEPTNPSSPYTERLTPTPAGPGKVPAAPSPTGVPGSVEGLLVPGVATGTVLPEATSSPANEGLEVTATREPTRMAEAAASEEEGKSAKDSHEGGPPTWIIAVAGMAVGASLVGYITYRRLFR